MIFTGGVFYHLRALRFQDQYWSHHREGTERFLRSWNPRSSKLLLIGPSGAYSLPAGFLARFQEVVAFEPDPLARMIFERRTGIRPRWIRKGFSFDRPELLGGVEFEGFSILFCNILGQLEFKRPREMRKKLADLLRGREWASYHDALSGRGVEFDLEDKKPGKASLSDMRNWIYVRGPRSGEVVVNSHTAPELFEETQGAYEYWQWRITPDFTHLIEGVYSRLPDPAP